MEELDRITIDPEICLGQPTIRRMRITVSVILKLIAGGMPKEEILKTYPELEEEDITQALRYAAWLTTERTIPTPMTVGGMSDLQFLADMNISPLSVKRLRDRGWDIFRVSEVMKPSSKDIAILEYARQENRVIITQDLDFSKLLALRGFDKPSLINIRLGNPTPEIVAIKVQEVMESLAQELASGIVVTIDENSIRFRSLPIRVD